MWKEWLRPELIWFLVGLGLLFLEFISPGLIIFFFGVGACVVAVICLVVDISLNAQLAIFLISSVLLLISLRRWLKGIFRGYIGARHNTQEDLKDFIGERAVLIKEIKPGRKGKVEFHGTSWGAEADEGIPAGASVEIIGKDNITLKVKRL